jgi:serine/threonine protein kinase
MIPVVLGLQYIHRRGLAYGSPVPTNVLTGTFFRVKSADFGISPSMTKGRKEWALCGSLDDATGDCLGLWKGVLSLACLTHFIMTGRDELCGEGPGGPAGGVIGQRSPVVCPET